MSTEAVKQQPVSGTLPAGGALVPVGEELPAPTSLASPACRRRGILQERPSGIALANGRIEAEQV
jgi:hypothetical protein